MGDFSRQGSNWEACQYVTVAASQTTNAIGGLRAYLESVTIIPASTGGQGWTIYDGSTAIATIPTAAHAVDPHPYRVHFGIRATNATTGFKITTGTSVTCIAVGRFSS
jgi:hypothetical protein